MAAVVTNNVTWPKQHSIAQPQTMAHLELLVNAAIIILFVQLNATKIASGGHWPAKLDQTST